MRRHILSHAARALLGAALLSCAGSDTLTRPSSEGSDQAKGVPLAGPLSRSSPVAGQLSTTAPAAGALSASFPGAGFKVGSIPPGSAAAASAVVPDVRMLWQNTSTGDRSIWLMTGTSWAGSYASLPQVPTTWSIAGSGDFNADGNADIVWQNTSTGDRSIWFMTGNTWGGTYASLPQVPIAWSIAGVGDFNADGKPDLVWQNTTTGDRSIWFMNGSTWAGAYAALPVVPTAWRIAAVGDFNGDGKPDLVWQNISSGERSIWFMNGSVWAGAYASLLTIPTQWRIAAATDFDGDGDPDLVWQNITTGERSVWLMVGSTWGGAYASLLTVPTQWSIAGILGSPVAPTTGTIRVATSTTGALPDPTGYTLGVTTSSGLVEGTNIGINSFGIFTRAPGSYTVTLGDIASNCTTTSNPRTVTVTAGAQTETTFNVACPASGAPGSLSAVASEAGVINLVWTDNTTNETAFRVEECVGATCTNFAEIGFVAANSTGASVTGVVALTTYRYRVRASTPAGFSEYSNIANATALSRKIRIINSMPEPNPATIYDEVVSLKLALNAGSLGNADLLTNDNQSECQPLPGPSIGRGQSSTFNETVGNNYTIFIQIGAWEPIFFGFCPTSSPWSRTKAFPFTSLGAYHTVYTSANITDHRSGTVDFQITGVFTSPGTMKLRASQGGVEFLVLDFTIGNF